MGTTSACAENTEIIKTPITFSWNYLRVRGEYVDGQKDTERTPELPPRARRIRHSHPPRLPRGGTTSACAENTSAPWRRLGSGRNYLRVRGEYCSWVSIAEPFLELPPRARRIRDRGGHGVSFRGTTSACAENTDALTGRGWGDWNYLRVRGEYSTLVLATQRPGELPPRARRIPQVNSKEDDFIGTTSACAENTTS